MENQPQNTTTNTAQQSASQITQNVSLSQSKAANKPLPLDSTKSNRKLVIGCVSAFGCSLFLLIAVILGFIAYGSPDNPIFKFLGSTPGEAVGVLAMLINLIFLFLVFVSFILVVIGAFKISVSKKDDKVARRSGAIFTFGSLAAMVVLIVIWVFIYISLPKGQTGIISAIITAPPKTTNLTAPVVVKFDGSKAPINKNQFELLSYDWSFDDGSSARGNPQTHTFTDLGNYNVKLTLTLREKVTGTETTKEFTQPVTVTNKTATVIIKADPLKGVAPLTVNFDGSDSKAENGEITAFAWDLDGDGAFNDASEDKTSYTFDKVGKYTVSLRVTDSTGAPAINSIEIETTLPDTPVADIAIEGVTGDQIEAGKSYVFSGAASVSPTGTVEKYTFDFGDGTKPLNTRTATHVFEKPGVYEIKLSIEDSNKKKGELLKRFTISAPSGAPLVSLKTTPAADAGGKLAGKAPFDVILDGSGSTDPNDNIVEYAWDFDGDGTKDDTNAMTSHRFAKAGTFPLSLTVTDSTGLSSKAIITVEVESSGLTAAISANPASGVVPLKVVFDASSSSYSDGEIVSYEWDFGEGAAPRIDTSKVTYQYAAIGTFTAKVTAISNDGKRATAQTIVNVRPVSVKACFTASSQTGEAPLEVQFDPSCSAGTVTRYRWNFANLGNSTDRRPKFTFMDPGEYEVTLEVADNQNVIDTFASKITVSAKKVP